MGPDPTAAFRALPAWRRWLQFAWLSVLLVLTVLRVLAWRAAQVAWRYAALPGVYASGFFGSSSRRWVVVRLNPVHDDTALGDRQHKSLRKPICVIQHKALLIIAASFGVKTTCTAYARVLLLRVVW